MNHLFLQNNNNKQIAFSHQVFEGDGLEYSPARLNLEGLIVKRREKKQQSIVVKVTDLEIECGIDLHGVDIGLRGDHVRADSSSRL